MLRPSFCGWGRLGVLLLAAMLAGCSVFIPASVRLEEFRSPPQELVVVNQTNEILTLIPSTSQQPDKALLPGEQIILRFEVITLSKLDRASDDPWYRRRPGAQLTEVQPVNETAYLRQKGEDVHLDVRRVDGETWAFLFSLGDCWQDPPQAATHRLAITGEPMAGIPMELCP